MKRHTEKVIGRLKIPGSGEPNQPVNHSGYRVQVPDQKRHIENVIGRPKIPGSGEPNPPVEPIHAEIGRPIDFGRLMSSSGLKLMAKRNTEID